MSALRAIHAAMQDGWRVLHLGVALVPVWLALVLFLPPSTFATAPIAFAVMARLGTEHEWAVVCAACGGLGLWGLWTASTEVRRVTAYVLSTLHGTLAICLALAAPSNTGSGTYAVLALLAYSLAWRNSRAR